MSTTSVTKVLFFSVLCGLLCSGCGRPEAARGTTGATLHIKSGLTVPADCQQWLVSFLDAFNTDDGARILQLTAPRDVLVHMEKAPEPQRKSMVDSATMNVQKITSKLGRVKSCSVEFCKERTFAKGAQPPGPMGEGSYYELQCKVKCSNSGAKASFNLFRKSDSSAPIQGLWNFTW